MQPEDTAQPPERPDPEPAAATGSGTAGPAATGPALALRRRRTVLRTLFALAVLAVLTVTTILFTSGGPPATTTAAASASAEESGATPTTAATPSAGASTSTSASASAPASSAATPSAAARTSAAAAIAAGWPNASNTGAPRGVALHSCPTTITKTAAFDRCKFAGDVTVRADNVRITRSLITGQVDAGSGEQHGLVISDTTIDCGCLADDTHAPAAVLDSNFTLERVNIFNSGHGAAVKNNVVIQDSYIHGQGANTDAHKDGIYAGDGSNVVLRHNSIECNDGSKEGCTAAIGLLNDFGNITNWVIDDNLLNTNGSYCIYGGGGTSKNFAASHITITNNHFGRMYHAQCGAYGPVTYFDVNAAGNVWRDNVWADSGSQVAPEN